MSKQVTPSELGTIVMALLTDPTKMGQMDSESVFSNLFRDIGEVVANYCGGDVNFVSESDISVFDTSKEAEAARRSSDGACLPLLSISPNDSMPSPEGGVWAAFDPEGWEDEAPVMSEKTAHEQRAAIQEIACSQFSPSVLRNALSRKVSPKEPENKAGDVSLQV